MTIITGDLILVTDRPATVTEVWIRAGEIRTHDGGLVLEDRDREPVHNGWLEINVLPGPAILTLVSHGTVRKAIPIVVPDAPATSLEDAVNAAKLAQPSLKNWLEELAASIIAGTKGPQGERGPAGPAGPAPYIQNGTWWTGDVDTGIDATGPQGGPGIAPHIQGETWWVGEVDTGIRAQGPKGDPGPAGTLDLVDESVQTTIDTVAIPAIEGARDEALGQVSDAVAAEMGNTTHVISTGATTHANKVVRLNDDGKLAIGTGTVTAPTDPTNKAYVDLAVNTKADRTHKHNATDIVGNTTSTVNFATDDRFANHLVKLDGDGKLSISTAGITEPSDPTNKSYVDTAVASKSDSTHSHNATDIIGHTTHIIGTGTNAHANKVVRLDENGKLAIGAGAVTGPTDPTSKTYVDTAVNTKADRTHKHNAVDITGGTTSTVNYSVDARFAGHLVKLNSDGKLTISTAGITLPTDPSNKSYVDTAVAAKADSTHQHNAADITGDTTSTVNYAVDARFAGHLVKLNGDGKLTISTAGITAPTDPSNKQYTDATAKAAVDALQAKIGSRLAWWN